MSKKHTPIDDGCGSGLLSSAAFAGELELPCLHRPDMIKPNIILPFSMRNKRRDASKFLLLREPDVDFDDILRRPKSYVQKMRNCAGVITLEPVLLETSNYTAQLAYTYRSRELALALQHEGINVIPHVCWGEERSYAANAPYDNFAFLGLPPRSILAIGAYGDYTAEPKLYHLRHGLANMLNDLSPAVILIFGKIPDEILSEFKHLTRFLPFPDWGTVTSVPQLRPA
ncbi:MAG: DUF4417 domain-containing protein [bacterium]|nr:DUF4417 domain-containing protein [bacterium]